MIDAVLLLTGFFLYLVRTGNGTEQLIASLLLFVYMGISIAARPARPRVHRVKCVLLLIIILLTVYHQNVESISQRHARKPGFFVHDHSLQMEEAVSFLVHGQNPYAMDYRGTPMEPFWRENPALDHVIALPFTFLKSVPFFLLWQGLFGWYDDRISQLPLFWIGIGALYFLFRDPDRKLAAVTLFVFNPLFSMFFEVGRSDVVFLSMLFASLATLRRGHTQAALLFLVLSATSKHMAWFMVPFFLTYLYATGYLKTHPIKKLAPSALLACAIVLPFVLWDWHAFVDDIYGFPAGTLPSSYPIAGLGLSMALVDLKIISNIHDPFPSALLQLLLLPLLAVLIVDLKRRPGMGRMVLYYGAFLWPILFLSRFLYDNYLGVVITVFGLALLLMHEESTNIRKESSPSGSSEPRHGLPPLDRELGIERRAKRKAPSRMVDDTGFEPVTLRM